MILRSFPTAVILWRPCAHLEPSSFAQGILWVARPSGVLWWCGFFKARKDHSDHRRGRSTCDELGSGQPSLSTCITWKRFWNPFLYNSGLYNNSFGDVKCEPSCSLHCCASSKTYKRSSCLLSHYHWVMEDSWHGTHVWLQVLGERTFTSQGVPRNIWLGHSLIIFAIDQRQIRNLSYNYHHTEVRFSSFLLVGKTEESEAP